MSVSRDRLGDFRMIQSDTTYPVILCDPPWHFDVWSRSAKEAYNKNNGKGGQLRGGRSAEDYYRTMPTEDLCALPLADLASPHCALFLWATWPNLPDALRVGAAWGFEYKTVGFDWLKRTRSGHAWHTGMGYWTRANSEPCLLFTKGNPRRRSVDVPQVLIDWEGGMFETETIATPI